jgi:hypothetical protein
MSFTAPMAITLVSSANAAMIGSIADIGLAESETSTISSRGGARRRGNRRLRAYRR